MRQWLIQFIDKPEDQSTVITIKLFPTAGVLTRSKKTEHVLIGGTLIVALADQVEGAVVQWRPDEEPYSHLGIEVEICELKRYREKEFSPWFHKCWLWQISSSASDYLRMATSSHLFSGTAPTRPHWFSSTMDRRVSSINLRSKYFTYLDVIMRHLSQFCSVQLRVREAVQLRQSAVSAERPQRRGARREPAAPQPLRRQGAHRVRSWGRVQQGGDFSQKYFADNIVGIIQIL